MPERSGTSCDPAGLPWEYIEEARHGDGEDAFFGLLELGPDTLPLLKEAFREEADSEMRALILEVVWQSTRPSVVPFLGDALFDPASEVWKEALDGLVALASMECLAEMNFARERVFRSPQDSRAFRGWIDEAVLQATEELTRQRGKGPSPR